MYIKKLKNGKLKLSVPWDDFYYRDGNGNVIVDYYFDEMELINNLYIDTIEGYFYIIDYSRGIIYDYYNSCLCHNPLKVLLDDLADNGIIYLYPAADSSKLFKLYLKEHSE